MSKIKELNERRAAIVADMNAITATIEQRSEATFTAEEQEMFRGKMEAYCSHDGMTLDEYREQYLEEADQAPSQTMQM